jgi:hypothetical protein
MLEGKEHFEQLKKLYSTDNRPVYKVKESDKGFCIEKPNGWIVNDHYWQTREEAESYLDVLIKFGYCTTEKPKS